MEGTSQEGNQADAGSEATINQGQLEGSDILGADNSISAEEGEASVFGEEIPTEEQLSGVVEEESDADDKSSKEKKTADSESVDDKKKADDDSKKADTDADAEAKKVAADDKKAADEAKENEGADKDKKPPKGYVSNVALREEREARKDLALELKDLKLEIATLKANPIKSTEDKQPDPNDFKVLTDAEFNELVDEDPQEALRYQAKLRVHEKKQSEEAQSEKDMKAIHAESSKRMNEIIKGSVARIDAIPGLRDEGSTLESDLVKFASDNGMNEGMLELLTNPATVMMPSDGKGETYLLGDGAASLIETINNLYTASKDSDPAKLREEIVKELTPKITKELLNKFKTGQLDDDFISIGDAPSAGSDGSDVANLANLTEAQFSKLSQAEQQKALGG